MTVQETAPALWEQALDAVRDFIWGPFLLCLLVGAGVYFCIGTRFFALRHPLLFWKKTFGALGKQKADATAGGISPFQAVSTALASTFGTGNIVGVATALVLGGPGSIFWMWCAGLLGMMTKYAEIVLALRFRVSDGKGGWLGGAMYSIARGLRWPSLAKLFAFLAMFASFGIGNMTQANAVAEAAGGLGFDNRIVIGLILMLLTGCVILGGIQSIGKFTAALVPFMGVLYVGLCAAVLFLRSDRIGEAVSSIVTNAFGLPAVAGGAAGYGFKRALQAGVARGVFTNEAGLGSAAIAHAAANTRQPVEQGLWGAMEVFLDTCVMCTLTAVVILVSGAYTPGPALASQPLAHMAFTQVLGAWGGVAVSLCTILFASATLIGWSYYGECCALFLFPCAQARARRLYRLFYLLAAFVGANMQLTPVWTLADALNGLMALPNLISLFLLSGIVFKETRAYKRSLQPM